MLQEADISTNRDKTVYVNANKKNFTSNLLYEAHTKILMLVIKFVRKKKKLLPVIIVTKHSELFIASKLF